jgi:hypothetical protein
MTEDELARRLARDLGPLATDAQWSAVASDGQPQGSYSDAIADAKEEAEVSGALDSVLDAPKLRSIRRLALLVCLERLELHYSTLVDTSSGGDTGNQVVQRLSQVRVAIGSVRKTLSESVASATSAGATATEPAKKAIGLNLRGKRRPDYDVGGGNVVESA